MENVFALIKSSGQTANKLEKEIGFPHGYFSKWRSGYCKPSLDALVKVADHFGVSVDWLVGREQPGQAELPEDQRALVAIYSELDELDKAEVRGFAKAFYRKIELS